MIDKMAKVMREFSKGELHSGSKKGPIVKSSAQAKAIGMSEARKAKSHALKRKVGQEIHAKAKRVGNDMLNK